MSFPSFPALRNPVPALLRVIQSRLQTPGAAQLKAGLGLCSSLAFLLHFGNKFRSRNPAKSCISPTLNPRGP